MELAQRPPRGARRPAADPLHGARRAIARPHLPALLRDDRRFRRFWAGQSISLLGDQISLIGLPLVAVLVLDANAAQMGYLVAAELAPNLLFSLHAGAWADRRARKRRTMIATDVGRALLIGSIPVAYAFDALTFPHMLAVAFLMGTLSVLFHVSYSALYAALVPRERLVEGGSITHGSRALSYVAGPSIGGLLVQAISAPVTLVVDACSYIVSALILRGVEVEEPAIETPGKGHVVAGLRWVFGNPIVRAALGATATINFFNFVFFALFILYATTSLDIAPATLGLVLGAGAVGGLLGAFITNPVARRIGIGRAFALGCVVFPAPLLLVPLADGPQWVILACLFLAEFGSGLGVMMLDISAGAIAVAVVPDRLRSRVSGAYMVVNYGVRPLGALVGGALGTWIGLRETLWIATAGALLGVLWLLPSPILGLRELPEPETAV
ncbi:MAG TPA: MFS transporter [Gaiellaceae bacterium]|nr:MFS transporter [Gaiellaceae bacterium]